MTDFKHPSLGYIRVIGIERAPEAPYFFKVVTSKGEETVIPLEDLNKCRVSEQQPRYAR